MEGKEDIHKQKHLPRDGYTLPTNCLLGNGNYLE